MKPDLFLLKELVLLFRNDLLEYVFFDQDHPTEQDEKASFKQWEKTEAYSWIFLEPRYKLFWGASDESSRKSIPSTYPEALLKTAYEFYSMWGMKTIEASGCKAETAKLKEIYKYKWYGIPAPTDSESLIAYVERLRALTNRETYSQKIWEESLGSFLKHVRNNIPPECLGFIDVIFPEDRTFYSDVIIRLIRKEKFPTNIVYTYKILKNLSEELLWGDPRAQHGAAEALAFSWLCLISARLKLPTEVKLLYQFDPLSLSQQVAPSGLFPEQYFLKIPTLYGHIPMEVSKLHFDFFSILREINLKLGIKGRIFKSTEKCLREVFDRAVKKLNLPETHGEITFTTFTSWPTEYLHRTQIDNERYRHNP